MFAYVELVASRIILLRDLSATWPFSDMVNQSIRGLFALTCRYRAFLSSIFGVESMSASNNNRQQQCKLFVICSLLIIVYCKEGNFFQALLGDNISPSMQWMFYYQYLLIWLSKYSFVSQFAFHTITVYSKFVFVDLRTPAVTTSLIGQLDGLSWVTQTEAEGNTFNNKDLHIMQQKQTITLTIHRFVVVGRSYLGQLLRAI